MFSLQKVSTLLLSALCTAAAAYTPPTPELLPGSDPFAQNVSKAQWLWDDGPMRNETVFYRYTVNVNEPVKSAWFMCAQDDTAGHVRLNGVVTPPVPFSQPDCQVKFMRFEPKNWKIGRNVLTFSVTNGADRGGIILRGEVILESGKVLELSSGDNTWKASGKNHPGWETFEYDDSKWSKAVAFGDVRTHPWSILSNVMDFMMTDAEKKALDDDMKKAANVDFLKNEKPWIARICWKNNLAGLDINGQVVPPMNYLVGENPWMPQVADMVAKLRGTGIKIMEYQLMATKAFIAPGKYDFSYVENDINRIIALNPDAAILVAVRLDMGPEWMANNPDELIGYAQGPTDGYNGPMGRFRAPSMASEKFRDEIRACGQAIADFINSKELRKRVVAVRVSHGIFSEWHYYGMSDAMPDTGKAMTKAFRKYLRDLYKTDAALQKAWHNESVTFETAQVPDAAARGGKNRFLKDWNSDDRACIDFYNCLQEVIADTLLLFASEVKKKSPHLLLGAYYGYTFCMGYPPEGQTQLMDKILSSPYVDFLSSPYSYYPEARNVGGDGQPRMMLDLFRKYGKLAICEDDTRTYLSTNNFMQIKDKAGSLAAIRRNIANCWINGTAVQLLDFDARRGFRCTFNDPEFFTIFHQASTAWNKLYQQGFDAPANDIAVIFSPYNMIVHGYPDTARQRPPVQNIIDRSVHALKRSGACFDLMELNTFLESKNRYKLVVFLNTFTLSEKERKIIKNKLQKDRSHAVWTYAPGYADAQGFSNAVMKELTGIDLRGDGDRIPMDAKLEKDKSVLGHGDWRESPWVYCRDKNVEVLARYSFNQAVAVAAKKLPNRTWSIFAGVPITRGDVWTMLLDKLNIHCYTRDNSIVVNGNRKLLMVHTAKSGVVELNMPAVPRKVTEILSGEKIRFSGKKVTLDAKEATTWLLHVEY